MDQLTELGYYALAGHTESPRDLIAEARTAEALGLGAAFVSERFFLKDAAVLSGALGAVTETLGIATAATNFPTRHPMVTATMGAGLHRLTDGRFCLGLGRGFDFLFDAMGVPRITGAQLEDAAGLLRRLWTGEKVFGHDGPAGSWPFLGLVGDAHEDIPLLLCALGERTLELAGRTYDAVVLHTFFSDQAVTDAVAAVRRGAEQAGRDPDAVRIWAVLATVGDHLGHDAVLKKTVGRLATYLQAYGDLLARVNGWDPAPLERFRTAEVVTSIGGAIDDLATTDQLEAIGELLPDEWLAAAATGPPERCAAEVVRQLGLGVDSVVLHGATPGELAPVVEAYRAVRPAERAGGGSAWLPANPGRSTA